MVRGYPPPPYGKKHPWHGVLCSGKGSHTSGEYLRPIYVSIALKKHIKYSKINEEKLIEYFDKSLSLNIIGEGQNFGYSI